RLGAVPLVMQLPIGTEADFKGVVDLVSMKALVWSPEAKMGEAYDTVDIPDTHLEAADEWRGKLLESVAENDEEMMELYLEGQEPTEDQLKAAIRRVTLASTGAEGTTTVTPVFCGTAFKNKGVQPLLDAIVRYLPAPLDVEAIEGHSPKDPEQILKRKPSEDEPMAALVSKIASDPHLGKLTFIRVYSGRITTGTQVLNSVKGKKERIGKIYRMHANKREEIEAVGAGDIVAVMGLKQTTTGETLCDPSDPVILESMEFPAPVIEVAIEPKSKGDQEKLGVAIQRLAEEDPSFQVKTDEETGQTIISGMGELHLDVLVDRMKREFKVEANVGKPQVAYRESLRKTVEKLDYTHKKQTGGSGQFAKVQISVEPLEGDGYEFVNKVTGGRIPREYIPSVDAGCQEAMEFGVLAGYPLTGVRVTLLDGAFHDVDSSEMAFKIAGSIAFKEAARKASPALLEPMMKVEVTTPEDYMGDVIGDINSRRGQVQSMDERSGAKLITGLVPLSEMFGYVGDLRSKTSGRANYSMQFDSYAEVPKSVAEEIIAKVKGE
ncbi:MAG: elongation factor G, partial [Streptomyces sp.]